ncbi:hypothetical protein V5E97_18990 [Singulisphaera sp. Ch08]|uniref:Uncharacterized protein n=1 Tax=Singulisphaera sp. Ch08 TaxID=3120278 RepID=A0AAU7CTN1_9BACT
MTWPGTLALLVSTNESRGYLRPGLLLKPAETMAVGAGNAESNIAAETKANNLNIINVGAT